ncbi:hypothetical protein MMC17_003098 [Xylographa soralifera]|nr:hypothetical protein [Xylographa soralifera]
MTLMFRDESDEVVRKARTRKSSREQKAKYQKVAVVAVTAADLIEPAPIWDTLLVGPQNSIKHQPNTYTRGAFLYSTISTPKADSHLVCDSTIEEQGARFFMNHYVSVSPNTDMPNCPMFEANPLVFLFGSKVTRDTRICLGLAGLANVRNDQSIMVLARSRYASALRQTIEALQNPAEAKKDGTVGAAAMLAMFEMITCDRNSKRTWAGHITGAAALLKERGLDGPKRRNDIRTFVHLCFAIFIKCLQSDESVPPDIVEWFDTSRVHQFECDLPAWWLASKISQFVNLRASIRNKELIDPTTIIPVLYALEADLAKWVTELPPEWTFTTVISTEDTEIIFEGQCHVYQSLWIAIVWNHYRAIRILVNSLLTSLLDTLSSLQVDDNSGISQKHRLQSLDLVSRLATDICSSIPFQLNHNSMAQGNNTKLAPTLTGAFTVLWPLKVAASTTGVSESLYQWVRSLLQSIGNKKGVRFALFLTQMMEEQRESWQRNASTIRWGNNQLSQAPVL